MMVLVVDRRELWIVASISDYMQMPMWRPVLADVAGPLNNGSGKRPPSGGRRSPRRSAHQERAEQHGQAVLRHGRLVARPASAARIVTATLAFSVRLPSSVRL